ncbi:MAG: hypothetical protein H0U85_01960 [Gemmatimonadales bacterium]|nr:hypothetical protein [Gemmatimonadales bacterium]
MTADNAHDELRASLPEAALQMLDDREMQLVHMHVDGCDGCTQALAQYTNVAAALLDSGAGRGLDQARHAAIRSRLLARTRRRDGRSRGNTFIASTGWATAAGLAGVLLAHHGFHQPLGGGWVVAGALVLVLGAVVAYALRLRSRLKSQNDERAVR